MDTTLSTTTTINHDNIKVILFIRETTPKKNTR